MSPPQQLQSSLPTPPTPPPVQPRPPQEELSPAAPPPRQSPNEEHDAHPLDGGPYQSVNQCKNLFLCMFEFSDGVARVGYHKPFGFKRSAWMAMSLFFLVSSTLFLGLACRGFGVPDTPDDQYGSSWAYAEDYAHGLAITPAGYATDGLVYGYARRRSLSESQTAQGTHSPRRLRGGIPWYAVPPTYGGQPANHPAPAPESYHNDDGGRREGERDDDWAQGQAAQEEADAAAAQSAVYSGVTHRESTIIKWETCADSYTDEDTFFLRVRRAVI